MPEKALVAGVDRRGRVTVLIERDGSACFGCLNHECKRKGCLVTAENPLGLQVKPGDRVGIAYSPRSLALQALWALLPPALGFAAGFVLAGLLFPAGGDPLRAAAGTLFMFAAALGYYRFRRRFPPRDIPRITGVV